MDWQRWPSNADQTLQNHLLKPHTIHNEVQLCHMWCGSVYYIKLSAQKVKWFGKDSPQDLVRDCKTTHWNNKQHRRQKEVQLCHMN